MTETPTKWPERAMFALIVTLIIAGAFIFARDVEINTDPRQGWTDTYPMKRCDGTTLIYARGLGVVPDSPECYAATATSPGRGGA